MTGPLPRRRPAAIAAGLVVCGVLLGGSALTGCPGRPAAHGSPPAAAAPAAAPASGPPASAAVPSDASADASAAGDGAGDPVTVFEMADPVVHYQEHVAAQLALLAGQTKVLARDTEAGDDAAAKQDWRTAHLTYHRLGAAYGAFGALGQAIDGLAGGLPGGTDNPGFTGFHKVEQVLWRGGGARAAAPATARLAQDVAALQGRAGQLDISANTFSVRAHEILEDTLQVTLTGADDYGSGTATSTAAADLDGTRTVIELLRPLLERRSPGLTARIEAQLNAVGAALTAAVPAAAPQAAPAAGSGQGTAIAALPLPQRQRLDAAVGQALETLAVVPGLLKVQDED
jgi:hypothetical protein